MKTKKILMKDAIFTIIMLAFFYFSNLVIEEIFGTRNLIPMTFVLGVFLISIKTQGYFWGITASLASVLLVNYAFTYPYYAIDLITPECLGSAVVMLIVSVMTGTLTTQLKIQEKIKADIEKERMRANLLRAVSHDLRTPLTSIYGSSSVIIDNYDYMKKEQQIKLLRELNEDAEWLIQMVENLLSVTRVNDEKVKIIKTSTALEELIDNVLVKFKKRYPDQRIDTMIPEAFIMIPMDAMLIQQVLMNILENAMVHAKGLTKIELKIEIKRNKAVFSIADDGCGISEKKMKELFTGYLEQREESMDSSRHNMGIGLSVCAAIIKAHKSELHVEKLKEKGTRFYFALEMEGEDE